LLVAGIGLVVLAALLLIGYGYYTDRVAPRSDIVFKIGDRKYDYSYLEMRVKSDVAQGRFDLQDTANSVTATISRVQREELTRIIGRERGVTVSQNELDDGIRDDLDLSHEITHDEIGSILSSHLLQIKLPLNEYLNIVRSQVIEKKVRADLIADLPAEAEQVNLLYIQAGSQAGAIQAKQALDDGTDFGVVASQYSQDASTNREDGKLGWVPREALDPELADVAFSITGLSGIIETKEGFYIIDVLGKETRAIDSFVLDNISRDRFNKLLETAFDDTPFLYNVTEQQLIDLATEVGGSFG
jgi:parvulin-like peptidyl-prolyl isomerase